MTATPAAVSKEISAMRVAIEAVIPAKRPSNLLIGTWNLRALGDVTPKWTSAAKDSPKRNWRAIALIAEVVRHFDVVAVQEVKRNTTALRFLLERLGPTWRFVTSDVTEGSAGNAEHLAFLYDGDRIQPSGLVGEIVLPPSVDDPLKQFARTPYAASFSRGKTEFILTTVHVLWGGHVTERLPEIQAFAAWMRTWADRPSDWNENLLVLGDFNLDRIKGKLHEAFVMTGLWPPPQLDLVPRTIFDNDKSKHFYDQIAWFSTTEGESVLKSMAFTGKAGSFDFLPHVFPSLTRNEISWRISDHYPLWVEFEI